MKQKPKRVPITVRISREAHECLLEMVSEFLKKSKNSTQASQGKIIETLLLREDAQAYVEKKIFS